MIDLTYQEEFGMISITEECIEQLKLYEEEEGSDLLIRVAVMSGAEKSPNLGIMMDERSENDDMFSFGELKVIIEKKLMEYCRNIVIEYVRTERDGCAVSGGFKIHPEVAL